MEPAGRLFAASLGLLAVLVLSLGFILPPLVYRGRDNERYALRNHYVSELGEVGISRLALVYNGSLVVAGLGIAACTAAFFVELLDGWAGAAGAAAGAVAGACLTLTGFFPMNRYQRHIRAARAFFALVPVNAAFAIVAGVRLAPARPAAAAALLTVSGLCVAGLLAMTVIVPLAAGRTPGSFHTRVAGTRPRIIPFAITEWTVTLLAFAWVAVVSGVLLAA